MNKKNGFLLHRQVALAGGLYLPSLKGRCSILVCCIILECIVHQGEVGTSRYLRSLQAAAAERWAQHHAVLKLQNTTMPILHSHVFMVNYKRGRSINRKQHRKGGVTQRTVHQFLTTILTLRSSALEHKHLSWSSVTSLAF